MDINTCCLISFTGRVRDTVLRAGAVIAREITDISRLFFKQERTVNASNDEEDDEVEGTKVEHLKGLVFLRKIGSNAACFERSTLDFSLRKS